MEEDRKYWKRLRKEKSAKDRSKFKQSNKKPQNIVSTEEYLGSLRIVEAVSAGFIVENSEKKRFLALLRGGLKEEKTEKKNLAVVGDFVKGDILSEGNFLIKEILPRNSVLLRQDNLTRKKQHIIAANVDYVGICVSLDEPRFKFPLVDRYLIAAEKGGVKPFLVITKCDLATDSEELIDLKERIAQVYPFISLFFVREDKQESFTLLKEFLKEKTVVFSGQSGVGKTTVVNHLTGSCFATAEIVLRTKKGSHTTTHAKMVRLEEAGFLVDTPGIRSFGIWDLDKRELRDYFIEFTPFQRECCYGDCSHTTEEDCAVKKAVNEDLIPIERYDSYLSIFFGLQEKHLKR